MKKKKKTKIQKIYKNINLKLHKQRCMKIFKKMNIYRNIIKNYNSNKLKICIKKILIKKINRFKKILLINNN